MIVRAYDGIEICFCFLLLLLFSIILDWASHLHTCVCHRAV